VSITTLILKEEICKSLEKNLDQINSNQAKFVFIVLLLGMCSIEGAEEATGTIAVETRELEAIEAVINGGHGTSMRPFVK
jgi:hypothetical protein